MYKPHFFPKNNPKVRVAVYERVKKLNQINKLELLNKSAKFNKFILIFILTAISFLVIIYIVMKIVGFFKEKKRKKNLNNYYNNDRDKEVYSTPVDDYTTGEIIDVEYEDVDKKEK